MVDRILAWILARVWRRVSLLALMAVLGLVVVRILVHLELFSEFFLLESNTEEPQNGMGKMENMVEKLITSLHVIVLGLPVVAILWWFRTHDTLEQIQKTKESTDVSILFSAQKMLFEGVDEKSGVKASLGFALLGHLRKKGSHQEVIDLITCKINLAELRLIGASMRGMDLSSANLQRSNLAFADLRKANLASANLMKTDFSNAKLQGANLSTPTNFPHADLMGAEYSDETKFPNGFDPDAKGMIEVQ